MRSPESLSQQVQLQKAGILAIAGKPAEATEASAAAGGIDVKQPTQADMKAIQALLPAIQAAILAPTPGNN